VLRDYETGAEIKSVLPPRNDTATQVKWSLGSYAGKMGYLEIIDGSDLGAYAWLAVSEFTPPFVSAKVGTGSHITEQLNSAIQIVLSQLAAGDSVDDSQMAFLANLVGRPEFDGSTRRLAARALLIHSRHRRILNVTDVLQIGSVPRAVDAAVVQYCRVAASDPQAGSEQQDRELLKQVFAQVSAEVRTRLVSGLAGNKASAELLVQLIESGVPSPEVLRDDRLVQQLSGHGSGIADRVKVLRDGLPAEATIPEGLISNIARQVSLGEGDTTAGEALFGKHCIACHRRGGKGGIAGPQLDGIGTRGSSRLLEDILNPNANVDIAFRTSVLVLDDGRSVTGIVRDAEDPNSVLVIDPEGKQSTIAKNSIEEKVDSRLSLMPGGLLKLMSEKDLVNLVQWLER
jgi:putative heme-binding domain-containing protein